MSERHQDYSSIVGTKVNVKREDGGYTSSITSVDGRVTYWATSGPIGKSALVQELSALNRHPTEIGDALDEADWYFERRPRKN